MPRIKFLKFKKKRHYKEIAPDEIFLDSTNLPEFEIGQSEGRLEKPITISALRNMTMFFILIGIIFTGRTWFLQINQGQVYAKVSEQNRLHQTTIFAERGLIYDRNGLEMAWNSDNPEEDFAFRNYTNIPGLSHVLGYITYPKRDSSGFFYREKITGAAGVEAVLDNALQGKQGVKIVETDAIGQAVSQNELVKPKDGNNIYLSINAKIQEKFFKTIEETAVTHGFKGGAGIIMDINTGELLVLTSFPETNSTQLSIGNQEELQKYLTDSRKPFLFRAISGLYTPGSIVKPFMALAGLTENIITPETTIISTGSLRIKNPYDPAHDTIFNDWKAHGAVDLRKALAVSSNVYFYEVGGGYKDMTGLGIEQINRYMRMFGFGTTTGLNLAFEPEGTIPNPNWKKTNFDNEEWRIGDTYHTAIGQYGFQVSPLQVVRAVASIANNGKLLTPQISSGLSPQSTIIPISLDNFQVVREGMRLAVKEGTAKGLDIPGFAIAAKTGTAQLGANKDFVNSWAVGFFPYEKPRYAFTVVMEGGPAKNLVGGVYVMRQVFDWMAYNTPEYTR